MQHLVSARQFSTAEQLNNFFKSVNFVSENSAYYAYGKIMATIFYEPSTRTRFSFEAAMHRLGGSVISEGNPKMLSTAKGETLEDTVRTISKYVDVIVLRHPDKGAAIRATNCSEIPIINAGDGAGEHPTQALLDMYTIQQNFNLNGLSVLFCGDLYNGRTVHSLCTLLGLYNNLHLICCSPNELQLPAELIEYLKQKNVKIQFCKTLEEGLSQKPNLVYMTRLQKERCETSNIFWKDFCMTPNLMTHLGNKAIVMHPLPRNEELVGEVDDDPRCVYFTQQIKNGIKVRMALLCELFYNKISWVATSTTPTLKV